MDNLNFTHLHVHTQYSLLDGACKIPNLVKRAKELGMNSLAITDHGVMYGVVDFYKECLKEGIKPVIGCEAYVAQRSRFDKDKGIDERRYHLILLAENNEGYKNLMKLVSKSFIEGFYYKPRVDKEILRKYSKGIIALSACLNGEVPYYLGMDDYDKAKEVAKEYIDIWGKDNFFLEMQANGMDEQEKVNDGLRRLSKELGLGLVITNDVHYIDEDDYESQDILMCIQTAKKVSDTNRMKMSINEFYLKSKEEIYERFKGDIEAMENTQKIADRCSVTFEFNVPKLPKFKLTENITAYEYIKRLCDESLKVRYKDASDLEMKSLKERIDYELDIIYQKGYVDYILIVWDFIKYAKDNNIMVGPGRGSAAGSLVCYVLGITDVDPVKYNLIFERFLNPERMSMPDIDIDFCYVRRQEVIDYVTEKYGHENVSQIITFGTMSARSVIRDVGRVLDIPYAEVDRVAKMIPFELKITIDKALAVNKELRDLYENNIEMKYLIDMSKKLEGLPRHASTHAAGVVIAEKPLDEYIPLAKNDENIVTQFPMTTVEDLGLLKMDFLGLRTLTVIQNTVKQIKYNRGIDLDMNQIDIEDSKVYELISKGNTSGIFQLESKGMTQFLKELEPSEFEDIIAGVSLYRPGPMEYIPDYIKGKKDRSSIVYDTPELEKILKPTYGIIVYQEQVMEIFRELAGYSFGRSDVVRRAMGKKKMDVMLKEKDVFINGESQSGIDGCIKRGIRKEAAEIIFNKMIDFANYAFNKSHSACYALIAYQTAYLKTHYTAEFMAAMLSSIMDSLSKVAEYILEAQHMGIEILPPDVNESYGKFSVSGGKIRFALSAIKNVGKDVIENLVIERQQNGNFISMTDFITRMQKYNIGKSTIECLIKASAFDSLGGKRSQYLAIYKSIYDDLVNTKRNTIEGQINLFSLDDAEGSSILEDNLPNTPEFNEKLMLAMEKEMLGIYVSGHPLTGYEKTLSKYVTHSYLELNEKDEDGDFIIRDGEAITAGGMVSHISVKSTKNNNMMAFVSLEDLTGVIEIVVFPNKWEQYRSMLKEDEIIVVKGRASIREESDCTIIAESIIPLSGDEEDEDSTLRLKITIDTIDDKDLLEDIRRILTCHSGNSEVEIFVNSDRKVRKPKAKVEIRKELIDDLEKIIKKENILIE